LRGVTIETICATDSIILVGTENYGIFRSTNGGHQWYQYDSIPDWQIVEYICSITHYDNYFFAAAESKQGGTSILRSSDGGRTWQFTPGGGGLRILLAEHNGLILAAGHFKLGRSSDDGDTWDYPVQWLQLPTAIISTDSFPFMCCQTGTYRAWDTACSYWEKMTGWTGDGLAADNNNLFYLPTITRNRTPFTGPKIME